MIIFAKISGEYFSDEYALKSLYQAAEQKSVILMAGGGNLVRGRDNNKHDKVYIDRIGMLSTMINCIRFKMINPSIRIFSNLQDDLSNKFNIDSILECVKDGNLPILAGGLGCGYISTDTAMVVRALELGCDTVIKVSKIGFVFDKDPKKYENAKPLYRLTYEDAIKYNAFDHTAIIIAKENRVNFMVIDLENFIQFLNNLDYNMTSII